MPGTHRRCNHHTSHGGRRNEGGKQNGHRHSGEYPSCLKPASKTLSKWACFGHFPGTSVSRTYRVADSSPCFILSGRLTAIHFDPPWLPLSAPLPTEEEIQWIHTVCPSPKSASSNRETNALASLRPRLCFLSASGGQHTVLYPAYCTRPG